MQQPEDLLFSNTPPKYLRKNAAAVDVQHREQERISPFAMDVDVLDVHAQLLHGTHRFLHPEANELPLFTTGADHHATKQMLLFHQPVHLFMVNDKAKRLQVLADLDVTGKEHELLGEHKADGDHHTLVLDHASIGEPCMSRGFAASFPTVRVIIVRAVRKPTPSKEPCGFALSVKELNCRAFLFDS